MKSFEKVYSSHGVWSESLLYTETAEYDKHVAESSDIFGD